MAARGQPKTGGRKAGTPNRNTTDLMAKCEARGVDVFDLLLEYVTEPCDMHVRLSALKELAQYLYPKRKAIEHSGQVDTNPYAELTLEELEQRVAEKLKAKK